MAAVSPKASETSRKIVALIFQQLSSVGQVEVAKALDASESTVSRLKEQVPQFVGLLVRCGLKVVPAHHRCEDPEYIAAVEMFAHRYMEWRKAQAAPKAEGLTFEDPE